MSGITLVYRVDDVIVRRQFRSAAQAMAVYDSIVAHIHAHWVIVRNRATGSSWFRRSGRKS